MKFSITSKATHVYYVVYLPRTSTSRPQVTRIHLHLARTARTTMARERTRAAVLVQVLRPDVPQLMCIQVHRWRWCTAQSVACIVLRIWMTTPILVCIVKLFSCCLHARSSSHPNARFHNVSSWRFGKHDPPSEASSGDAGAFPTDADWANRSNEHYVKAVGMF